MTNKEDGTKPCVPSITGVLVKKCPEHTVIGNTGVARRNRINSWFGEFGNTLPNVGLEISGNGK